MAANAQTTADATGRVFEACRVPSIAAEKLNEPGNEHPEELATTGVRFRANNQYCQRYSGLPLSAKLCAAGAPFLLDEP